MADFGGLYALPPGADFAAELVRGLLARMAERPPEALAGVTIYANSGHTLRAIEAAFRGHGALLLPRLRLIADLGGGRRPLRLPGGCSSRGWWNARSPLIRRGSRCRRWPPRSAS